MLCVGDNAHEELYAWGAVGMLYEQVQPEPVALGVQNRPHEKR